MAGKASEGHPLTIMFTDLEGSTSLRTRLGDTASEELMRLHDRLVRERVGSHTGRVVDATGDGFMVTFGSVRKAIACAIDIQRTLERNSPPERGENRLRVRIGINTGEVIYEDNRVRGEAVHGAARVMSKAKGGEILLSEVVKQLAGTIPEVEFRDRGRVLLKGFPDTWRLFEAVWRTGAPGGTQRTQDLTVTNPSESSSPRFVGRERELAALLVGLEAALAGEGRLFLLSGEPGIGKSRLADELALQARGRGARVLWGRCWEAGGAPAYWPWVQSIRSYVRDLDPERLKDHVGTGAPYIAQMIPEVGAVLTGIPDPPSLEPEAARFRLFDATTTFLVNAARERPLVLLLDDLHAADEPSLLLLQFVVQELAGAHILIIAAYRDVDASWRPPFLSAVAELGRAPATHPLNLSGLAPDETGLFIEATTGISPPEPLVAAIHNRAEGNPLFVAEVSRLLASEGRLEESQSGRLIIPEGVREVIRQRLERLSSDCVELLTLGSVFGREFGTDTLARVSARSAEDLVKPLEEAARAGVVVQAPGPARHFRFTHVLVRDALYFDLPSTRRIELHREIGEVLEELYGKDLEPRLAEIAHHFIEAAPIGDITKAIDYARRAGDRATRLLAYEEAVRLYRMALDTLDLTESSDDEARCELLVVLGEAEGRSGDIAGSRGTFLHAARLAERIGLLQHLVRATVGYAGRLPFVRGSLDPNVVPLLRAGLAALPEDDDALRARLMASLSCALRDELDRGPRTVLAAEAVSMARRLGDATTLTYALAGQWPAVLAPENATERLGIAEELVEVAESIGDTERAADGHLYRVWTLFELGDMPGVYEEVGNFARGAEEMRQPAQMWDVAITRSTIALFEGRFQEAEPLISEIRLAGESAGNWTWHGIYTTQTFALRREQGRLGEWRGLMERAVDQHSTRPVFRCILANLYAEVGDRNRAANVFERFAANDFAGIPRDAEWLLAMTLMVEVAEFLNDVERCETLYDLLLPYRMLNVVDPGEFSTGAVSRYLGVAASVMARWDEAAEHHEAALEMNERMGARPWLARTQRDYARMLLARDAPGDRERAIDLLIRAQEICTDLGMVAVEDKSRTLLAELGVETETASVAAAVPKARMAGPTVFRREGEYWSIAFDGPAFRLRDLKGVRYLARLLAEPGREFHVLDLVTAESGQPPEARPAEAGLGAPGDAGEVLDAQARAAYRDRVAVLEEDIEEARSFGDAERAAGAQEELDLLVQELAGAVGLGGRARRAGSGVERARVSVTQAIRTALGRIREQSPPLGGHLDRTVRTGTFCSYVPDPRAPVDWRI